MASRFSVETIFKAVDRVTGPVQRMEGKIGKFSRHSIKALRLVSKAGAKVATSFKNVGKSAAMFTAGAVIGGGAALTLFNKATVESEALAKSVGVSVSLLEGLGGAVHPAGFELDNIVDLVEEMNNKLGESAGLKEITPVTESLAILGMRFREIKSLKPEDQFKKIMDAALGMADAQKAASALDILLGGEANKIFGVLGQRGKTIDDILKAQEKFNFKTDKGRAGAKLFIAELSKIETTLFSIGSQISGLLGDKLAPIMARLTLAISNNKAEIADFIGSTIDRMEELAISTANFIKSIDQESLDRLVLFTENVGEVIKSTGEAIVGLFEIGQSIGKAYAELREGPSGVVTGTAGLVSDVSGFSGLMQSLDSALGGGVLFEEKNKATPSVQSSQNGSQSLTSEITLRNETSTNAEVTKSSGGMNFNIIPTGSFLGIP